MDWTWEKIDLVEPLSRVLHALYQKESRRQAGEDLDLVRWPNDYDALPDNIKEYDRVLARYIIERVAALRTQLSAAEEEIKRYNWALSVVAELSLTLEDAKEVADVALGRR